MNQTHFRLEATVNKTLGVPQSHSDVLNKEPKVLLIGYGWVGQFVHKYFTKADIWTPSRGLQLRTTYDVDGQSNYTSFEPFEKDGIKSLKKGYNAATTEDEKWDVAFISVPTPMKPDGSCDTSMVEEAVKMWRDHVDLFVIRSTVEIGTTDYLREEYKVGVVMQPEYVGETLGHPNIEVIRDPFIILGGLKHDTQKAAEAWSRVLHANCKIRQTTALTAELCKYMENSFLGIKVLFVNEFRQLAEQIGVDYLELREAWLDDPRIGRSHTLAYKQNPGFSGKCLPKDINAVVKAAKDAGSPLKLMEAALKINAEMRKNCTNTVPLLPCEKSVKSP